ncbi:LA2681 family HEPN domain-containing protein [uncultured Brevundimonas sp.]|uniref:LA2681 family HEPN domain-containing protein n=1 Tax=uncultured Brevundimonas sp. TaxID=213418 RepID=UPI0030EC5F93|tara:strand:- start:139868 stop:141448 length:1581 start_codon:yes stop_codon:yes gene_type:complete
MRSPVLDDLLELDLPILDEGESMNLVASIVDLASDEGDDEALSQALALIDQLVTRPLSPPNGARLQYFRANAWSGRRHIQPQGWPWVSEAIDNELLAIRSAVTHAGFIQLHTVQQAQIHTNHGNLLNHIGRFVEAIEAWDQALALVPKMAMANGNRGIGLAWYSGRLYDSGHAALIATAARRSFGFAVADDALIESEGLEPALKTFAEYGASIDRQIDVEAVERTMTGRRFSLGRSKDERAYRQWCLAERLFLSPLNDICADPVAAHDALTLPTLVEVGLDRQNFGPPLAIRQYNLLKQEYVTARYALYEALTSRHVHFSDRGVLLHDTLDFPAFGFAVERAKLAFRTAYAILDKVGYFLNAYLSLGHPERQVSFRNVWFASPNKKDKELHPFFVDAGNWPLCGLFWLSKDIFDDAFKSVTTTDARELYELRNHLEHKFVSVHDDILEDMALSKRKPTAGLYDIDFTNLTARALRQLKLSRAALIYLSLGVHAEEGRREAQRGPGGLSMPMGLYTFRDADKRREQW